MYKQISIVLIFVLCLQGKAAKHPTAFELLDRYAETQDKLQSFIIKSESTTIINGYMKGGIHRANRLKEYTFTDLRFDGDRISLRTDRWGEGLRSTGPVSRDMANYRRALWDGKSYSLYVRGPGTPKNDLGIVTFGKEGDDTAKEGMISIGYKGHELLGIFFGDHERVDSVLRRSENISVRDKMEKIATSDCYVIEAVVKDRGRYTLWIDPQHGYNIAQATVEKGENAILYGKAPGKIKVKVLHSLRNVSFKKINDIWLPKEVDIELDRRWVNGDFANKKQHYKLIEMMLDPDHNALGSFERDDIKNGAKVYLRELPPSINYTWQDGKVVDEKGRVIMDCRPKKPVEKNNHRGR